MKTTPIICNHLFVLVCLSLLSLGPYAQAAPTETESDTEPYPELTIYSSYGNSVVVNILNLTPYDMTYDGGTLDDQLDRDRKRKKSFTFAPLGVPGTICGTGLYPMETVQDTGEITYITEFSPTFHTVPECLGRLQEATDPVVAPVPFLVSWQDNDGLVEESWLKWTIHDVICNVADEFVVEGDGCTQTLDFDGTFNTWKADIDLGLWFHRSETEEPSEGRFFLESIEIVVSAVELIESPLNPYHWKTAYLAVKEMVENMEDWADWNLGDYTGATMTVSAYPFPREGSGCFDADPPCKPAAKSDGANDNVMLQWNSNFTDGPGDAEGSVVVLTQVLRGHDAWNNEWEDDDEIRRCCTFRFGSMTTVNITLMLPNHVATAAVKSVATTTSPARLRHVLLSNGFGSIRQYLLKNGHEGYLVLRDIVQSLPSTDVQLLIEATQSTLTGQVRKEEEAVLRRVAKALKKSEK